MNRLSKGWIYPRRVLTVRHGEKSDPGPNVLGMHANQNRDLKQQSKFY